MIKHDDFNYFSLYFIAKEAENRGIKVKKVFPTGHFKKKSFIELKYKKRIEYIVGQRTSKTDVIAYWVQKNKEYAKYFFKKAGLSVAEGGIYRADNINEIKKFTKKIGYPVVVKPISGIQGKDVHSGIQNEAHLRKTLKQFKGNVLVEKHFQGEEYRLFATNTKFVAAIWRKPANVTGDGKKTIQELIEEKNKDPRRGTGHKKSLVRISIDSIVKDYLKQQGKTLKSVLAKDEVVYLRQNSNISTGGDSYDVTDIIHPEVKKIAVRTIKAIPGLAYAGIDYLTTDVTKRPNKNNYIIIEVNDSPMISMHHIPYEGKSRNAAAAIIDQLFPETKKRS